MGYRHLRGTDVYGVQTFMGYRRLWGNTFMGYRCLWCTDVYGVQMFMQIFMFPTILVQSKMEFNPAEW